MSVFQTIHGLPSLAAENGASDVHIKTNKPAFLRLIGRLLRSVIRLVEGGLIWKADTIDHSPNPRQLKMNLNGILLSHCGIIN